jgi:hypothetical protein
VTPPVFEDFLKVLTRDLPCITPDNSNGSKLLALEFKCDRLLTKFNISLDSDYAFTQHENVIELLIHVSDLSLPETDESLKSYAYTVSIRGIEGVKELFSGDLKMCLTAIVSINATGDLSPMWVTTKCRIDRCEGHFCSHSEKIIKENRLILTHQERS